jgi:hypothetical protein
MGGQRKRTDTHREILFSRSDGKNKGGRERGEVWNTKRDAKQGRDKGERTYWDREISRGREREEAAS